MGILGVFCCLTSIPAIILGHIGLREAKKTESGRKMAIIGTVLGYLGVLIPIVAGVALFCFGGKPIGIRDIYELQATEQILASIPDTAGKAKVGFGDGFLLVEIDVVVDDLPEFKASLGKVQMAAAQAGKKTLPVPWVVRTRNVVFSLPENFQAPKTPLMGSAPAARKPGWSNTFFNDGTLATSDQTVPVGEKFSIVVPSGYTYKNHEGEPGTLTAAFDVKNRKTPFFVANVEDGAALAVLSRRKAERAAKLKDAAFSEAQALREGKYCFFGTGTLKTGGRLKTGISGTEAGGRTLVLVYSAAEDEFNETEFRKICDSITHNEGM